MFRRLLCAHDTIVYDVLRKSWRKTGHWWARPPGTWRSHAANNIAGTWRQPRRLILETEISTRRLLILRWSSCDLICSV